MEIRGEIKDRYSDKKTAANLLKIFKKIVQMILYIPIQLIFVPISIIGLLHGIYKEMVIGRKMGISFTAIKTLQYRWNGHYFNIRPDPYTVAFTKKLSYRVKFQKWPKGNSIYLKKWENQQNLHWICQRHRSRQLTNS